MIWLLHKINIFKTGGKMRKIGYYTK